VTEAQFDWLKNHCDIVKIFKLINFFDNLPVIKIKCLIWKNLEINPVVIHYYFTTCCSVFVAL